MHCIPDSPLPLSLYISAASAHITEKVKGNTSTPTIKQIASRSAGREEEEEEEIREQGM